MYQIELFEEIDAPPDVVWTVLLEFEAYPEWNPFVRDLEGLPLEAEHLQVRIEPPDSGGMTVRPEVVAAEENRRLAWLGRLGVPFLFDGYHEFHLEPVDENRTRLLHRETFRGALVPLLLDEVRVEQGFREMNETIKERVEKRVQASI